MKKLSILFQVILLGACSTFHTDQLQITPTYQIDPKILTRLPPLEIGDGGFLSNFPCSAPCFFDIYPGETSPDGVVKSLKQYNFLAACRTFEFYNEPTDEQITGWDCPNFSIDYSQTTQLVAWIRFEPTQSVILRDAIDTYGAPDVVIVSEPDLPDNPSVSAVLYYIDLRIELFLRGEQTGWIYSITPETSISTIVYLDEASFDEDRQIFSDESMNWDGYRSYP
jgi:hypothetical protein